MNVKQELRDAAKKLLAECGADLVIGWGRGSLPMSSTPVFAATEEEADRLIFDATCGSNLTVYFTKDRRQLASDGNKTAVVAKGCDARSLVLYIKEHQIERDKLVIIGVPCDGIIDRSKITEMTVGKEILEFSDNGTKISVKGKDFELEIARKEVLSDSCLSCAHPDAGMSDIFVGEHRGSGEVKDQYAAVEEFEKLSNTERWERMQQEYSKCIRCYACRNVCPSCYCSECFVDQNDPQWIGKTLDFSDTMIFHVIRNLHVAGRCVECGSCERACPMDIKLLLLNRKVAKEVVERFGMETGVDQDARPAMSDFREDEKQDFIMG
jgi:ferredoxin